MNELEIKIILGLLCAIDIAQTFVLARLIYRDKESETVIRTKKIEMDGFEISVKNEELTVKPKE